MSASHNSDRLDGGYLRNYSANFHRCDRRLMAPVQSFDLSLTIRTGYIYCRISFANISLYDCQQRLCSVAHFLFHFSIAQCNARIDVPPDKRCYNICNRHAMFACYKQGNLLLVFQLSTLPKFTRFADQCKYYELVFVTTKIKFYHPGANDRNRTDDLFLTMEMLYRLSYIGLSLNT